MSVHSKDRKTRLRQAEYYAGLCRDSLAKGTLTDPERQSTEWALASHEARARALRNEDEMPPADAPYGGLCVP
jgi:hypothetical protein